jgi:hypothetical protein
MAERGRLLVLAVVLAISLLFATLIWRAHVASAQRAQQRATTILICKRLHVLDVALEQSVAASSTRAALLRIGYYRTHQAEIPEAQATGQATIKRLERADCAPSELPVVG